MGRETRNFKQTGKSRSADHSQRNYQGINRAGYFGKMINYFKKGKDYGQS
jgi:hypothetical protein